jgi:hypothetical protein
LTKVDCSELLAGHKKAKNIRILCPFCKNKNLRAWSVYLENPKLDRREYKAMISLCDLYHCKEDRLICKISQIKPKNKKLHDDIPQRMQMNMFCNLCKHMQALYVDYGFYDDTLILSWINPKKRNIVSSASDLKVKVVKDEVIKKRRPISLGLRYKILVRDSNTCQCCGAKASDGIQLHIDHIKPVSKGGTNDFENLQTLCIDCNLGKSNTYS